MSIMAKRKTKEEFIKEAVAINGNDYDYGDVVYVNTHTPVTIKCNRCNKTFSQTPHGHLQGQKCPFCSHRSFKYTINEVKKIINEKYNGFYKTDLITEYQNNKQKLPLICPKHGYFKVCLNDLNNGHACQKCGKDRNNMSGRKSLKQFIKEAKSVHNNKYDYSKVEYVNAHTKICIICPEHGEFWQTPNEHLKGKGCPSCNESKLETETCIFLEEKQIKYIKSKKFKWLGMKHLDFYLPDYNAAIECQGGQHFYPVKYFGGDEGFEKRRKSDIEKKELCKNNNIKIFYYTTEKYDEFIGDKVYNNLNDILNEIRV